jgi:beta-glucosidase
VEQLEDRCVPAAPDFGVLPLPPAPNWLPLTLNLDTALKGNPQVVFLGDSITFLYAYSPSFAQEIAPRRVSDLAIPGNTTSNVLWQLQTGALSGTSPKTIVLMIGINNLFLGQTPAQTAEGIAACVFYLRLYEPQAQVLLLGILPAQLTPGDPLLQEVAQTNALIAGMDDGLSVHFLDFGAAYLQSDGTFATDQFTDGVHPTPEGFQPYTDALSQILPGLLADVRLVNVFANSSGVAVQTAYLEGTFTQFFLAGPPVPGATVYASVANGPAGQVLDVLLSDGTLLEANAAGVFPLAKVF